MPGIDVSMTARDILDDLRSRPGRFGLALFAVALGMAVLTILLSILAGLERKSDRLAGELGADVAALLSLNDGMRARKGLGQQEVDLIVRNLPGSVVSAIKSFRVPTLGTSELLTVIATDDKLRFVRLWKMREGRFLDEGDMLKGERSLVLSASLADRWKWKPGDMVMLGRLPFRVVGIVMPGTGSDDGERPAGGIEVGENAVFIPRSVPPLYLDEKSDPAEGFDALFVKSPDGISVERLVELGNQLLSRESQDSGGFTWVTPATLVEGITRLRRTIGAVAGSITFLCLLLGGTTLMTLMLENIRSRVVEIGLRRAIGASRRDIAFLFVSEAIFLTLAASLLGMLSGQLLIRLSARSLPIEFSSGIGSLMIPFIVSLVTSLLFSYLPASRAAGIAPSEALRND